MAANMQERVQPNWRQNRGAWFTQEDYTRHFEQKKAALEKLLGPLSARVLRAQVPFEVGGTVDLYPFEQALPGTAFATMELIYPDGQGPQPNRSGAYELVACTRLTPVPAPAPLFAREAERSRTPYELMVARIWRMLTAAAQLGFSTVIAPGDTAELPSGKNDVLSVLFDRFDQAAPLRVGKKKHHLLLCMQIFPSELRYAQTVSPSRLISLLQEAGHYPYSDLDRDPVA